MKRRSRKYFCYITIERKRELCLYENLMFKSSKSIYVSLYLEPGMCLQSFFAFAFAFHSYIASIPSINWSLEYNRTLQMEIGFQRLRNFSFSFQLQQYKKYKKYTPSSN